MEQHSSPSVNWGLLVVLGLCIELWAGVVALIAALT
jgi:hypothetical protein